MKEKLIELLIVGWKRLYVDSPTYYPTVEEFAEVFADHLLANGVTVPVGEIDFDYEAEDVPNERCNHCSEC